MAVTIYDIGRKAGVSASTVSRVLNNRPTVDEKLAEAVRAAARELGYRRNAVAGNLRLSKTSLWAVIISDVANPFFTSVVRGIEDVAQETSYSVVLCNSDEDPGKEADYVEAVLAQRMAGVIISPSPGGGVGLNALAASGIPVVTIDREVPGSPTDAVVVDNRAGGQRAVAHLIENGYRRIACITGPANVSTATERLEGYQGALRAADLPLDPDLVKHADFREGGGHTAMTALLDAAHAPDAVFVANNLMTMGALRAIAERGRHVPPIGVVGFDDLPWADLLDPRLTTVAQPTLAVGRTAARLLLDRIATRDLPSRKIVLPTTLVVRDSSLRDHASPEHTTPVTSSTRRGGSSASRIAGRSRRT